MADTVNLQQEYTRGQEAQREGDFVTARESFELVLSKEPENAEVLHALAVLDLQQGMLEQAEQRLLAALELNRYGVGYQNSLGDLRVAQHQYREAESAYFEELRMRPDFALSHLQLGRLMMRIGNHKRAAKHFQSAVQFAPRSAVAANSLGAALMTVDKNAKAADSFKRALHLDPQMGEAQANLGLLKLRQGAPQSASEYFSRALELDDECAAAYRGLGLLNVAQGNCSRAIAAYEKCIAIDATDLEALQGLARILRDQGAREQSLVYFERAYELVPTNVDLLNEMAVLQLERGDLVAATTTYERALQLRPSDQRSLLGYGWLKAQLGDTKVALSRLSSTVQSGRADTDLSAVYALLLGRAGRGREGIAMLEHRLRKKMPGAEARRLHFTLGKLLDADNAYDLAFHHFRIANGIDRTVFDREKYRHTCEQIIEGFSGMHLERAARAKSRSDRLVFLLGMPRAGVRTIEHQIAKQERVLDLGDCKLIELSAYRMSSDSGASWPIRADQPTQEILEQLSRSYMAQASFRYAGNKDLVIDATWRNFLYIGVIELLFPEARVVYCTRDARDIALSTYFYDLQSEPGLSYASDMNDIAEFINGHKRVMAHWCETSNLPMHIVSYERMILDYDEEYGALMQFLGLADEQAGSTAPVVPKLPKPSFLKSTSLRKYRHYKAHLESFVEALNMPPDKVF
ncbi:MAG: tetratricopeptide repeat protein [Gammaproteobacteria bacterium]|nr:tetratricopeptide repeat protein [Gammaproteobacteria bacterium]